MQLRKLQLVGFKTFAEKTEIEIGEGVTAVVGPNGSGKSNIADAILWVMGEQNPRLLRGSDSRDVIFAGSDKRKPLGMAEVRLTVDNSDFSLPIRFAEVTITRRIYRSGESQYLLNNAPCRLKDIVELFLDTGAARGAYAFVSQSEIDAVLSARPEDRRELFEEAAGIKKYRVKKREAVRKLEAADSNLTRIRDILVELEREREPLSEQAETARRYLALAERLHQIEVDALVAEIRRADYELYAAQRERELDSETIRELDSELACMERASDAVGERLAQAEQESDSAGISRQGALTSVERLESQLQLVSERGVNAEQSAESLDAELHDLATRAAATAHEIESQGTLLARADAAQAERKRELAAAQARLEELERALAEAARLSQDRHAVLLRLAEERAQREAALQACRTRLAEYEARVAVLVAEGEAVAGQLDEAKRRCDSARESLSCLRAAKGSLVARRRELDESRKAARDADSRLRTALDAAQRLLAERASRLATLTELQESGEGFYQGVRAVMRAHREGRLPGFYAPAVDLLTVPEQYRVAIEVALGGSLQDIVCETEAEAKAAIEWLKANRAGRATFLALPNLRPAPQIPPAAARSQPGLLGAASELVGADREFAPVLQLLLGRVAVAEDLDSAIRASRRLEGWSRIVTLDGEVLTPGGALTGGSLQGRGAHLVGRKGEIDDLKRAMPTLRADTDRLTDELEASARCLRTLDRQITEADSALSETQVRIAAVESEAATADRDGQRISARRDELAAESSRLHEARVALGHEVKRWTAAIAAGAAEDTGADDAIAAAQEETRRLAADRDEARIRLTALEVDSGRATEKRAAIARSIAGAERALAEIEQTRRAKRDLRELAASRFAESAGLRRDLEVRLTEAREHLARCEEQWALWRDRRQALLSESFDGSAAIKEASQRRSQTLHEMHGAELRIARLEVRLAQAVDRLSQEYGLTKEDALARPDTDDLDRATVQEIARLRKEARAMGNVNTGAVEEYERLAERYRFLSEQRSDLERARESLLETITAIDESTRGIFLETFDAVAGEFARLFTRLFGGGTTKLVLTQPDDLLETGIDVIAQPPGKRAQSLSLLSGGERALTALALLFSFLAVRPSPFCLLDEVDAPLDGANVEKFVDLVKDFCRQTQFLVITHNPTTMEAAPRWYGVTMQDAGISRILSYKVPQEAADSERVEAVVLGKG